MLCGYVCACVRLCGVEGGGGRHFPYVFELSSSLRLPLYSSEYCPFLPVWQTKIQNCTPRYVREDVALYG